MSKIKHFTSLYLETCRPACFSFLPVPFLIMVRFEKFKSVSVQKKPNLRETHANLIGFPVRNPCQIWLSDSVFGCPGKPVGLTSSVCVCLCVRLCVTTLAAKLTAHSDSVIHPIWAEK